MEQDRSANGAAAQEISRGMISLYKQRLGRGPTKAWTTIQGELLVTVLEGSLTAAERTLAAKEQAELVRDVRRTLQAVMCEDITKLVEVTLQRQVICFLSDHSPDPDYAIEVVLLAPQEATTPVHDH